MPKLAFLLALLLAAPALGQAPSGHPPTSTVANLPAPSASASAGFVRVYIVTDGATAADCTTGGGATRVLCFDNGTAWAAVSAGGAGDGVGYDEILEEAAGLTKRAKVNFIGTPITCVDNAGAARTDCTVSAHTVDTTCNDAGVACLFAGSATEGGPASSGDTATAFFPAGTIEHERGGLEADVSAYAGLIRIAAGATSNVTNLSGLNTALGSSIADGAHTTDASALVSGTIPAARAGADHIDAITEIAAALKTGADVKLVTGTAGGAGICAEWNADGDLVAAASADACGAGGGAMPPREFVWPAASLQPLEHAADSIGPLAKDEGTNVDVLVRSFDDTTAECVGGSFLVPADIDTSGTVTFRSSGYAATAAASGVVLSFNHSSIANNESWDVALTEELSSTQTQNAVQDQVETATWTETVANLGWGASELVLFELCREPGEAGDDLSGDYHLIQFSLEVPRA